MPLDINKKSLLHLREEYLIYDKASFIVDVGGYLGLLLGHSVYSVLGSAVGCFR